VFVWVVRVEQCGRTGFEVVVRMRVRLGGTGRGA